MYVRERKKCYDNEAVRRYENIVTESVLLHLVGVITIHEKPNRFFREKKIVFVSILIISIVNESF